MFKVAILGCENSHANGFLSLIKAGKFPEIEVVGVYSDETETAEKLNASYGVAVMKSYDELVGRVDGLLITARHGDNHLKYAKPYMASGIPMFIDKPITCSEEDALELARLARANGVKLCGGSICAYYDATVEIASKVKSGELTKIRSGHITAPFDPINNYGNFYFYTEHLVDMMTTVFGTEVKEIFCDVRDTSASFIARYDAYNVTGTYTTFIPNPYSITVYSQEGVSTVFPEGAPSSDSFIPELEALQNLMQGGEMEKTYENFILPSFLLNALVRSNENGKWEKINEIKL